MDKNHYLIYQANYSARFLKMTGLFIVLYTNADLVPSTGSTWCRVVLMRLFLSARRDKDGQPRERKPTLLERRTGVSPVATSGTCDQRHARVNVITARMRRYLA